eukprot:TRINITY_DN6148_c0_g1_i2.p1 TRINITY_DN6148_c0_g1~~TRINITY_DN6148_c0_g1_i2.p1  ORF type:complete len:138 (+),score=33.09 TRINITY_DN6148_c0_g1_i2:158-571(+)
MNPSSQTTSTRGSSLVSVQNAYLKKLDSTMKDLTTAYGNLLKSSAVSREKVDNSKENYQLNYFAFNLIESGESLLRMINELKHGILVSDFDSVNENLSQQRKHYSSLVSQTEPQINHLDFEITESILELEAEYFMTT